MRRLFCIALAVFIGHSVFAAGYVPKSKTAISNHFFDEGIESFAPKQMTFAAASFTQKPDSTRTAADQKEIALKQNRKLGIFSILTAAAGIASIFIFPLMPFLLLPAGALLGLSAMKRSRKWKKDKGNGYVLGLIGLILSVLLIGVAIALIVNG